jgi:hypothetical protein
VDYLDRANFRRFLGATDALCLQLLILADCFCVFNRSQIIVSQLKDFRANRYAAATTDAFFMFLDYFHN